MLFVPVIDCVPDVFYVERTGQDYSVLTPLAMSEDGYQLVAVESRLLADDAGEYEFKFSIAVLNEGDREPFRIFNPYMARGYLPDEVRSLVMPCVLKALGALINEVKPSVIHRVTFLARPNDKALEKHQMITDTIVLAGLGSVETGTDRHDRKFWRMSKGEEHGQE